MMESLAFVYTLLLIALPWVADAQLAAFYPLDVIDMQISSSTLKLMGAIVQQEEGIEEHLRNILENTVIAGSVREGAMVSSFFKSSTAEGEQGKEVETEFEYSVMMIPPTLKHHVEDIPGNIGFVRLRMDNDIVQLASNADAKILAELNENGYLKPYGFKKQVLKQTDVQKHELKIKLLLAIALDVDIDHLSFAYSQQEVVNDFSSTNYIKILLNGNLKIKVTWGIDLKAKIGWWPDVANEWVSRQRNWPSKDFISGVSRHAYIITKPSGFDELDSELMYSFAHIENFLVSTRSSNQNVTYLVFKSMIYKWIESTDLVSVHSSIAKHVMFWTCEEYPPNHNLWSEAERISALSVLFNRTLKAIHENHLPHYFIPKVNVIGQMSDDVKQKIKRQINKMLPTIDQFIPSDVDLIIQRSEELMYAIKTSHEILDDLRQKNYNVLLKRPDLIPTAIEIFGSDFFGGSLNDYVESAKEKISNFAQSFDFIEAEKKVKKFFEKFEL